ncbi:MAG: PEP-CTERM sorting domain-containing protein [Verrucomicrobiota bacterium]
MKTNFKQQIATVIAMIAITSISWGQLSIVDDGTKATITIDFDDFSRSSGEVLSQAEINDLYNLFGVNFSFSRNRNPNNTNSLRQNTGFGNEVTIFDTFDPTGGDGDLKTPGAGIGNAIADWDNNGADKYIFRTENPGNESNYGAGDVLIIQETDSNNNLRSTPDDEARGGKIRVTFDQNLFEDGVTFEAFGILDIDDRGGDPNKKSFAKFFDENGRINGRNQTFAELGDGSYQEFDYSNDPIENVLRADFNFYSSGALSGIRFSVPSSQNPIPEPSTYGLIGAGLLGGLIAFRRIKKSKTNKTA